MQPLARLVKNLPAMRETWVRSLGWEDPPEKGTATHSSVLAWRIPSGLPSMGSHRVVQDWSDSAAAAWCSQGKNTEVVCHSLLQWTTFCQISPPWLAHLVAPWAWLSFIELDKAVVLVWLYWLVFYEYGFSVSALWCPLATPTILLGFLLPWAWGISSRLLQQSTAIAPYLGRGLSIYLSIYLYVYMYIYC